MMSTSVVNLVTSADQDEETDELTKLLQSKLDTTDEQSVIFEDETEPVAGAINFIRKNSVQEDPQTSSSASTHLGISPID